MKKLMYVRIWIIKDTHQTGILMKIQKKIMRKEIGKNVLYVMDILMMMD